MSSNKSLDASGTSGLAIDNLFVSWLSPRRVNSNVRRLSVTAMIDNKQARALLDRGLLSYLFAILWRSAAFTIVLSAVDYLLKPKSFAWDNVLINFVAFVILNSVITFLGLLMAAGRYRKRPKDWDDDA
jgi:hypothetical protein